MIKKININGKVIPVPIPIKSLHEAVKWVHESFAKKKGEVVTSVELNGKKYDIQGSDCVDDRRLDSTSVLLITIESSAELSTKIFDAVKDLSFGIACRIPKVSVVCWKYPKDSKGNEVDEIYNDLELVLNMIEHLYSLVEYSHEEIAGFNGSGLILKRNMVELQTARRAQSWKKVSVILVNRVEPLLKDIVQESDNIQLYLYSSGQYKKILSREDTHGNHGFFL